MPSLVPAVCLTYVWAIAQAQVIPLAGGRSPLDGVQATLAPLMYTQGVAVDRGGNVYISDADDHRVRVVNVDGVIRTVAGNGTAGFAGDGGRATEASLSTPYGVATDVQGGIYIADLGNRRVRKVSPDGIVTTILGGATGPRLDAPRNVAVDSNGDVYVSDFGTHTVYRIAANGDISRFAGTGASGNSGDGGPAHAATLASPAGLALDRAGQLYIADSANQRIRRVAGGIISGVPVPAILDRPTAVAVAPNGDLLIADPRGDYFWRVTPSGTARSSPPGGRDIAISEGGEVFTVGGPQVRKLGTDGLVRHFAGTGSGYFAGDGSTATEARLNLPQAAIYGDDGALYIADTGNNRIRRVRPDGVIETFAGQTFTFNGPSALAFDSEGTLYVADTGAHRVRRISKTGEVTTFAGTGRRGFGGDGGPAAYAMFDTPSALLPMPDGSLLVADTGNARVRRVGRDGTISSVAGNVSLNQPSGLALDRDGSVLVVDRGTLSVFRFMIGGPAVYVESLRFESPIGALAVDGNGTCYVSEPSANKVWRVDPKGERQIHIERDLSQPRGLAFDLEGRLIVTDTGNHRIVR